MFSSVLKQSPDIYIFSYVLLRLNCVFLFQTNQAKFSDILSKCSPDRKLKSHSSESFTESGCCVDVRGEVSAVYNYLFYSSS